MDILYNALTALGADRAFKEAALSRKFLRALESTAIPAAPDVAAIDETAPGSEMALVWTLLVAASALVWLLPLLLK